MSKPTQLSAASYYAKYLIGGNSNYNRLFRWLRLLRKECKGKRKRYGLQSGRNRRLWQL